MAARLETITAACESFLLLPSSFFIFYFLFVFVHSTPEKINSGLSKARFFFLEVVKIVITSIKWKVELDGGDDENLMSLGYL